MQLNAEQIQAQINALECAMGRNVLSVQFADERVQYRSVQEMIAQLEYLRGRLTKIQQPAGQSSLRYSLARFNCR